jgi:tRNA-Thr(GGU) m(6)t(6)A37 methyltransferase TsaA
MEISEMAFTIHPIGTVRRAEQGLFIDVFEPYRPGLLLLGEFSHVIVLWWAMLNDTTEARSHLIANPPYEPYRPMGVFACRSPRRPNPLLLTTCRLLAVDEERGWVQVQNIDALDGTPVIDLKAYFPVSDRVKNARLPDWLVGWPEWFPEEGLGL